MSLGWWKNSAVATSFFVASAISNAQDGASARLLVEEELLGEVRPNILDASFAASRNGARFGYLACSEAFWRRLVNNFALGSAVNSGKCEVIVDNKVFGPYGGATRPTFSADSKRYVFAAAPSTRPLDQSFLIVVDGVEGRAFEGNVGPPVFSSDGKRFAYAAAIGGNGYVSVDGVDSPPWEYVWTDQSFFCGEANRIVYSAKTDKGWAIIVEGQMQANTLSDGIGAVVCRRDGSTLYTTQRKKELFAAIGGELQGPYRGARWMEISTDGEHYSYVAILRKKREVVIIDGEPGPEVEEVIAKLMTKGRRLAFAGRRGKKITVVLDGREIAQWDELPAGTFSNEGNHFATAGKRGKSFFLWRDGVESPLSGPVTYLAFSQDGRRLLALYEEKEGAWVAIDEARSDFIAFNKETHLGMLPIWIDDSNAVAYGRKGNRVVKRTFRMSR